MVGRFPPARARACHGRRDLPGRRPSGRRLRRGRARRRGRGARRRCARLPRSALGTQGAQARQGELRRPHAFVAIGDEAAFDEIAQPLGQVLAPQRAAAPGAHAAQIGQGGVVVRVVGGERGPALEQGEQGRPEGPDVVGHGRGEPVEHLRGGVPVGEPLERGGVAGVGRPRDPEVAQHVRGGQQEHILRLDVAVQHPGRVGEREGVGDRRARLDHLRDRQRPVVEQPVVQRAEVVEVHDEAGQAGGGRRGVEHGDDVRMGPAEAHRDGQFPLEPCRCGGIGHLDDLDRHVPVEGDLPCPVHDRVAAAGDLDQVGVTGHLDGARARSRVRGTLQRGRLGRRPVLVRHGPLLEIAIGSLRG